MHPSKTKLPAAILSVTAGLLWVAVDPSPAAVPDDQRPSSTGRLVDDGLQGLVHEALERNPSLARARYELAAAEARAPQVAARPEPEVSATLFALPPETRVGPQRFSAAVRQELPLHGKLNLRQQRALQLVDAARADLAARQLEIATAVRTTGYELAFLDLQTEIVRSERATLERYDAAAQARYSAGTGLLQESVRIQAQITRIETRLLQIAERRAALLAQLNALRDRPAGAALPELQLPLPEDLAPDSERLYELALARRPELEAIDARLAAHRTAERLAVLQRKPGVMLGMQYTVVESREDLAGRISQPEGNGDDVFALTGSVRLPIWRRALEAAVDEARYETRALEEQRRALVREIENEVGDLTTRLPMLREHHELLSGVLLTQAGESLRSAETAYRTGRTNAVDLLDAEVVLFDVRTAAARTRTDHAIALALLERAVAAPLEHGTSPSDDTTESLSAEEP